MEDLMPRQGSGDTLAALDTLIATGLVRHLGAGRLAVTDPARVSDSFLGEWEERVKSAQRGLLRSRGQLAELMMIHAARLRAFEGPQLERVDSSAELSRLLEQCVGECRVDLVVAQPGGPHPEFQLTGDPENVWPLLKRGVRLRTLYQYSARFDPPTVKYAEKAGELGAESRTVTGDLARFVVFDRSVLVMPLGDARGGALAVRNPELIAFAIELFNFAWSTGEPLNTPRRKTFIQGVANQTKRSILQHLIEGEDDRTTARALGISVRTCQRHVSELMQQLGASTRLQLGYLIEQHGLLKNGIGSHAPAPGDTRAAQRSTAPP
ncbi:hypothetical protein FF041_02565 [Streptomyces jumonjinensis]|uniref:HTH luxR-type domain-containing protein n=2 Tax=Streptomyces jumonjinensis TaxID=1945 RepID=A0A646KA88_STRJU|nr:hypothetical protein [Streptomyces jumonjinensis]